MVVEIVDWREVLAGSWPFTMTQYRSKCNKIPLQSYNVKSFQQQCIATETFQELFNLNEYKVGVQHLKKEGPGP